MLSRVAVSVIFLLSAAVPSFGQQGSALDIHDVVAIIELKDVSPADKTSFVHRRCVTFKVDEEAASTLRKAGANAEFIAVVRSACYVAPVETAPTARAGAASAASGTSATPGTSATGSAGAAQAVTRSAPPADAPTFRDAVEQDIARLLAQRTAKGGTASEARTAARVSKAMDIVSEIQAERAAKKEVAARAAAAQVARDEQSAGVAPGVHAPSSDAHYPSVIRWAYSDGSTRELRFEGNGEWVEIYPNGFRDRLRFDKYDNHVPNAGRPGIFLRKLSNPSETIFVPALKPGEQLPLLWRPHEGDWSTLVTISLRPNSTTEAEQVRP